MNTTIKEAKIEDVENGLLEVFIEGYRFHQNARPDIFLNLSDEELKQDLISNFEKFKTLIILKDEKIIGYLAYEFKGKHVTKLHVDQLVITAEERKQGYGKMLIEKVKDIAKENCCNRIILDCWCFNINAMSMYEHIGFDRQRIIYEMSIKNI